MVEDVRKQHGVESAIGIWQSSAVEQRHRNPGASSLGDLEAPDAEVASGLQQLHGERPISTPHIEHGGILRKHCGNRGGQRARATPLDVSLVQPLDRVHRRRMRRILRKKLDNTV
jgi:hypothetical protein